MPTATYTPLANITLGSSASSVTFSNIPNTYRDLILVYNGTINDSQDMGLRFNGDSGANYSRVFMYAQSSGTGSASASGETAAYGASVQTVRNNVVFQIMDYSATDKHKTILSRSDNAGDRARAYASRWASTSAVTSITLVLTGGANYSSGSTFALFGVIA